MHTARASPYTGSMYVPEDRRDSVQESTSVHLGVLEIARIVDSLAEVCFRIRTLNSILNLYYFTKLSLLWHVRYAAIAYAFSYSKDINAQN